MQKMIKLERDGQDGSECEVEDEEDVEKEN